LSRLALTASAPFQLDRLSDETAAASSDDCTADGVYPLASTFACILPCQGFRAPSPTQDRKTAPRFVSAQTGEIVTFSPVFRSESCQIDRGSRAMNKDQQIKDARMQGCIHDLPA
jgi:hypothetical protein